MVIDLFSLMLVESGGDDEEGLFIDSAGGMMGGFISLFTLTSDTTCLGDETFTCNR